MADAPAHQISREALDTLVALEKSGAARLLVGPSYVQVELWRGHPDVVRRLDEAQMEFATLQQTANWVASALTVLARGGSAQAYARELSRHADSESLPSEETLTQQYELVRERFDIPALRRRWWLKTTTKRAVAESLTWEVGSKAADVDGDAPEGSPVPFATLHVRGMEPGPFAFFTGVSTIDLTLDAQDVGYFIESLERLRQKLDEASREE